MENEEPSNSLLAYKALADETRLRIVKTVAYQGQCGTKECAAKIDLSQPTLSHHIKILIEAKILILERIGTCNKYSLNTKHLEELGIQIKPKQQMT
jgi:ArsR family transcriptional regulator, arsenate/arsenite/antimonite-responsive transcriptional repressor